MTSIAAVRISDDDISSFHSLSALREAHAQLMGRRRDAGTLPVVLDEISDFILRATATGAMIDADDDRWACQSVLDYWANVLYRAGQDPPDATLVEFDPRRAPPLPDDLCPYLGLDAFRESSQDRFFGRQRLVIELLERLSEHNMLAVIGSSGSGKSSLVLAGLLPALRDGRIPGSSHWRYLAPIVPGSDPLMSLGRAMLPMGADLKAWCDAIRAQSTEPGQFDPGLLGQSAITPTVFVIDQFEEVFTLCDDEHVQQAFINLLLYCVTSSRPRHIVIVTMRSDFETFVARVPALQATFEKGQVRVTPLNVSELREAIEEPAERVGLKFEAGVIDALLQDTLGEPAALPLVQFTLLKLWEHRERNWVTWEAYRKLGGGRLALARSADDFYAKLIPEEQVTAKRILLRLVRPGDGLEVTSNRVRRDLLYRAGEAHDRIDRVLDKLIAARLVRLTAGELASDTQVEVAHEALVRNWPQLVGWLEEERAALTTRRRLEGKVAEWQRLGRGSAGLLDEVQLLEAERWLQGHDAAYLGYDPNLLVFAQASREALEETRQREANRQLELAHAQALAQASQQQAAQQIRVTRRARRFAVALLAVLMLSVASMLFALEQLNNAERNEARAQNLALAAGAQAALSKGNTDLALTLAIAAHQMDQPVIQAQLSLAEAAYTPGTRRRLIGHQAGVLSVAVSPDGRMALSGGNGGALFLWDVSTGKLIQNFVGHDRAVSAVSFSPDGKEALSCADDAVTILWDVASGKQKQLFKGQEGGARTDGTVAVCSVTFSPDGRAALTGANDTTLVLWDLANGSVIRSFSMPQSLQSDSGSADARVGAAAFSPDGRSILAGARDNSIILWDVASGRKLRTLKGHTAKVNSVVISADGETAISGSTDTNAIVWDVRSGKLLRTLKGHTRDVFSVALSPDGRTVLTGSRDGRVGLWDVATGTSQRFLLGHGASVQSVVFSPDGQDALSASLDFSLRMWDLGNGAAVRQFVGHTDRVVRAALSSDGSMALSAAGDNTLILWDTKTGQQIRTFLGHTAAVAAVAWSPDNRTALSGSTDTTLILWDVATGQVIRTLSGHSKEVSGVAWTPDGQQAVSAAGDNTLIVWDIATGRAARTLQGHSAKVNSVVISPDGRTALSASRDTTLILWDLATGKQIRTFAKHTANVRAVAWSADGQTATSGAEDKTVILWDVASGRALRTFTEHNATIWDVAFSPDGRTFISGSEDTTLIWWNIETGQPIRRFSGHHAAVRSVVFSPDGRHVLSGSNDGTLVLWRMDSVSELTKWAHTNRYVPELTCDQRSLYHLKPLCSDTATQQ